MNDKDIKQVLLNTLDEYTKYHAEKYAKYLFNEMHSQMAKQINNGIQFDFSFMPELIESYKYSSYEEWKAIDCCGGSCGCKTESVVKEFFEDDFDYVASEIEEQKNIMPMIHERNPDTGEVSSRKMRSEEWIISQYNRNRLADEQIKNVSQIKNNEE
tara:strand:+ start:10802 stop:11272 length:471 start_codon:yes stop_codon:yes gene_type:complete